MPPADAANSAAPITADWLETAWSFVSDQAGSSLVLPDGRCDCLVRGRVHADGSVHELVPVLTGPGTKPMSTSGAVGDVWVGVRLRPEAARSVWGHAISHARNRTLSGRRAVEAVIPSVRGLQPRYDSAMALQTALIDMLQPTLGSARPATGAEPEILHLLHMLHAHRGNVRVHVLADAVDWSVRHVTRRFTNVVGISPKRYADLMRVHAALHALLVQGRDASTVACDAGYADQAHFVRAVHRYSGVPPTRLPANLLLPNLPLGPA